MSWDSFSAPKRCDSCGRVSVKRPGCKVIIRHCEPGSPDLCGECHERVHPKRT